MIPFRTFRLKRAHKAREAAQRAYDAAKGRGDTRAMHTSQQALREATHLCLWLER